MKKLALFNSFYDTMKLYEDTYGEFGKASDMTRSMFYARLAYNSLAENIREEVKRHIELKDGSAEEEEQDELEPLKGDNPNDDEQSAVKEDDIYSSLEFQEWEYQKN